MRDMQSLVRKATSQHGLLTTIQLREDGVTKGRQQTLVREGVLRPVRRGVFRLSGAAPTWEQQLLAACLTPGAKVVSSHRSALRIWGLRTWFDGVEVAVPYPRNRALPGVTVHRSVDLVDDDIVVEQDIPVTVPARTLCDAGLIFPDREIQRMVDHAVATGLVTSSELMAMRRRVGERGRNGVVRLEEATVRLPPGAEGADSGPEIHLRRILLDAGLPLPVLQFPVRVGHHRYLIDVAYPSAKLGLEYDGVQEHTRVDRFVADRRRQNDLVGRSWVILRYTNTDLRDRPWVLVGQVKRHLADKAHLVL